MRTTTFTIMTAAALLVAGTVAATDAVADPGVTQAQARPVRPDVAIAGAYNALTPARTLDTRNGTGGPSTPFPQQSSRTLQVLGRGGVPAGGVSAVVLNVTVTDATSGGYLTVYPDGARPTSSNLNFVSGQTVANLVTVPVATDGTVSIYFGGGTGTVDVVADVNGWFASGTPVADGAFAPLAPGRILDTRTGSNLGPLSGIPLGVAGRAGVPADAGSVVLNVTVTDPTGGGFLTVYPGGSLPTASNLNFVANQTVPNLVAVPLSSAGDVALYNGSGGTVDVVVDVLGYFVGSAPSQPGMFGALSPARVLDTRSAVNSPKRPLAGLSAQQVPVLGRGGVPTSGVDAVVLNVTAVAGPGGGGFLSVTPDGSRATSNLNFLAGQIVPNLVIVPIDQATGSVYIYNGSGAPVDLVADVTGFVRRLPLTAPVASVSRYVTDLLGSSTTAQITSTLSGEGCTDAGTAAGAGSTFSLLEFGAQSDRAGTGSQKGVRLPISPQQVRLTYAQVSTAVTAYTTGFLRCRASSANGTVTIGVGTNTDGYQDSDYAPTAKGGDWATLVAGLSGSLGNDTVAIVGANDIEANFDATYAQAAQWVTAFVGVPGVQLVNNGAAAACPSTLGTTGTACQPVPVDGTSTTQTWTQAQYYALSAGLAPGRISVLPQIYYPENARQWENVDLTGLAAGGAALTFAGVLTTVKACQQVGGCDPLDPTEAYAAMNQSLDAYASTTATEVPAVTDIRYP